MSRFVSLLTIGLFCLCLAATSAMATTVTFDLGWEFSGATENDAMEPSGDGPWLRATFFEVMNFGGEVESVVLTLESLLNSSSEFVSGWYFNYSGDITTLGARNAVGDPAGNVSYVNPADLLDEDFKADGDGYFDIRFDWDNGAFHGEDDPGALNHVETYTFESDEDGFNAGWFNALSIGAGNSQGGLLTAAHVQGIGGESVDGSGWVTVVPEASSILLWGVVGGIFGVGCWFRRRRQIPA